MSELDEFIAMEKNPPVLDEAMWKIILKDRAELAGGILPRLRLLSAMSLPV